MNRILLSICVAAGLLAGGCHDYDDYDHGYGHAAVYAPAHHHHDDSEYDDDHY